MRKPARTRKIFLDKSTHRSLHLIVITLFPILLANTHLLASDNPISFRGRVSTYLYSFEEQKPDTSSDKRILTYQSLNLDVLNLGIRNISFHSYFRTLDNPPGDEESASTKIYNLFLQFDDLLWDGNLRVGRQYLSSGVARGKMDGMRLDLSPIWGLMLTGFAGAQEPEELSTKVDSWSSSNTWGGRVRYDRFPATQVGWSFNARERGGKEEARLTGFDVRNRSIRHLDLYGKYDFDLIGERTSYLVFRALSDVGDRISVSSEYAHHNPQIRSNSILSVVRQEGYDQVRFRPYVKINERWGLEGSYAVVSYRDDTTRRLSVGVNFGRGNLGFIHRTGYGGRATGAYGSLVLDLRDDLHARFYTNFKKYRVLDEGAPLLEVFVTSATFDYSGLEPIDLSLELQEARNPGVNSDLRLFIRANYRFRISQ